MLYLELITGLHATVPVEGLILPICKEFPPLNHRIQLLNQFQIIYIMYSS
jgi:hypothetical protein